MAESLTTNYGLKLGGDKGHGSFKLNLQLCNVTHPNFQKNTTLLAMCMAGDSVANLHVALDQYKEQLGEMEGMRLGYTSCSFTLTKKFF